MDGFGDMQRTVMTIAMASFETVMGIKTDSTKTLRKSGGHSRCARSSRGPVESSLQPQLVVACDSQGGKTGWPAMILDMPQNSEYIAVLRCAHPLSGHGIHGISRHECNNLRNSLGSVHEWLHDRSM